MGVYTIAKQQDITPQHVRRVHKKYNGIKDPVMKACGRKPRPIKDKEKKLVVDTYRGFWGFSKSSKKCFENHS